MKQQWFIIKDGIEAGPLDSKTLLGLARKGKIAKDTPVRLGDSGTWNEAGDVRGLFDSTPNSAVNATEQPWSSPNQARPETAATVGDNVSMPSASTRAVNVSAVADANPVVCPHCWLKFSRDTVLYISRHASLTGDSVLGADAARRFLPTRFTPEGHALDAHGAACPDMACPRCHSRIPASIIDLPSLIFSIVGAPRSGKSYFLTTMTRLARRVLPERFALSFTDADATINGVINRYEQVLFLPADPSKVVAIEKTEEQGELYNQALLNDTLTSLPKPFIFILRPMSASRREQEGEDDEGRTSGGAENVARSACNTVFYDNAGEQFQPGKDNLANPGTLHVARSHGLIFLFDPASDIRARRFRGDATRPLEENEVINQEVILSEMFGRVRRHAGLKASEKIKSPLVVAIAKFDTLEKNFPLDLSKIEPWRESADALSCELDLNAILSVSFHARQMALAIAPEVVATAETFAETVFFIPVSSFGGAPEVARRNPDDPSTEFIGVRPDHLRPRWVEIPTLILLAALGRVPIATATTDATDATDAANVAEPTPNATLKDNVIVFSMPGQGKRQRLPALYAGMVTPLERDGKPYAFPGKLKAQWAQKHAIADDDFWNR